MKILDRARAMMPTEVRVIGSRLRRSNRDERAAVERNFVLPPSLQNSRRRQGSVWGVAMMRNEADTVQHVVEHMFRQDIDALLIADNGSTDATTGILASLSASHPVHVVQDSLVGYTQATKMTVLSSIARRCGADWVVPFDADELWFAGDCSVGAFLRASDAAVVRAEIHNVFPRFDDDLGEPDPFVRMRNIDTEAAPFYKIAFRAHPLAKLDMGNVDVARRGRRIDGLFVAHYPWRSLDQMSEKLRHGRKVVEAVNAQQELAFHWRTGGSWSDDHLQTAWDDLLVGRAVPDLCWSPSSRLQLASSGMPGDWTALTSCFQSNTTSELT